MTDPAAHEHSDLRDFLVLIRRHGLLIAFMTIATAAATFLVTLRQPKQYTAGDDAPLYPERGERGRGSDPCHRHDRPHRRQQRGRAGRAWSSSVRQLKGVSVNGNTTRR